MKMLRIRLPHTQIQNHTSWRSNKYPDHLKQTNAVRTLALLLLQFQSDPKLRLYTRL